MPQYYKSYRFTCEGCGATTVRNKIFPFLFCGECQIAMVCSPEPQVRRIA